VNFPKYDNLNESVSECFERMYRKGEKYRVEPEGLHAERPQTRYRIKVGNSAVMGGAF